MTLVNRLSLWLLIALSLLIAAHAFLFQLGLSGGSEFHERFAAMPLSATLHVLGSGLALAIGGFQFVPGLRARHIVWHRCLGRTYLTAVALGGLGGLLLAGQADGGLVGRVGFALLAVAWLVSGWQAFAAIRRGDVQSHRVWMIRNFALTFAAVTLRIYLGTFAGAMGIPFAEVYPLVAWLCWVPNLIVAEWLIVATPRMAWRTTAGTHGMPESKPSISSGAGPA